MNEIKSYKDLLKIRQINKNILEAFEDTKRIILSQIKGPGEVKGIDYSEPYVQGGNRMNMDIFMHQLSEQLYRVNEQIEAASTKLEIIDKHISRLNLKLRELERLDYKVVYKKEIEGKTLLQISKELNYSYQYIREVYANSK